MGLLSILVAASLVTGRVTADGAPLRGVVVSDGRKTVVTDARGRYRMRSELPEGYVFITVPSGYEVPAGGLIPQFFSRQRRGAEFRLRRVNQDHCKIVVLTDMHLTGDKVDNDLAQFRTQYFPSLCRAVSALEGPVYTFCLGDMVTDGKWYKNNFAFPEYLREMEGYPTPLWNIMGNHDNDQRGEGSFAEWEVLAEQRFKHEIGPNYYSVEIGGVHFIMLDDIVTHGPMKEGNPARNPVGKYGFTYILDARQLAWMREDLKRVPKDRPVVVCLHVPFYKDGKKILANAEEVLALLEGYSVEVFAGHCHTTRVTEIAPGVLQHIFSSGSAVSWKLNDLQAPIVCDDGTPAGWQVVSIDGGRLGTQFQSCYRSPEESQMSVEDLGSGEMLIDIFNWDPAWTVSASCGGKPVALEQVWSRNPTYDRIRSETKMLLHRPTAFLGNPAPHYFRAHVNDPASFVVTATDRAGRTYTAPAGQMPYPAWGMPAVTVFEKGEAGYDTFRIPAIVRSAEGELLAFAEARKNGAADTGDIDLVLKRSADGGATWGPLETVWDDGENVCGNPAPVVDTKTGRVVLAMTWNDGRDPEKAIHARTSHDTRKVFCTVSDDGGRSWSKPRDITAETKLPEWTWYATGPCHAVQLASGRIVVPCNHGVFGPEGPAGTASHVIYSDDCGETWHIGGTCPVGNESTAAALPDGTLVLNMRRWKGMEAEMPCRIVAESRDGGLSFGPWRFEPALPGPRCQGSLLQTGGILWFCNPSSPDKRVDLTVQTSADGGKTWRREAFLPGAKAAYSDLTALGDGGIGVLYERGEKSPYEQIAFARLGGKR